MGSGSPSTGYLLAWADIPVEIIQKSFILCDTFTTADINAGDDDIFSHVPGVVAGDLQYVMKRSYIMYMYMHMYVCVCMYVCTCMYVCMYVYVCTGLTCI